MTPPDTTGKVYTAVRPLRDIDAKPDPACKVHGERRTSTYGNPKFGKLRDGWRPWRR